MSCILSIIGKDLDVETLLLKSKLPAYKKTYNGEPKFKTKPDGEKMTYSFISVETSVADFDNLEKQVNDTIHFLKENEEKMEAVLTVDGVEWITLNFGQHISVNQENRSFSQTVLFPNELLRLAGRFRIDVELSIYPKDR